MSTRIQLFLGFTPHLGKAVTDARFSHMHSSIRPFTSSQPAVWRVQPACRVFSDTFSILLLPTNHRESGFSPGAAPFRVGSPSSCL